MKFNNFYFLWSDDTNNHIVPLYARKYFSLKMVAIVGETFW